MEVKGNDWYAKLLKPKWAPPGYLFGPVWAVLYILIFSSYGKVLIMFIQNELTWLIAIPFILNLLFNLAFTPLQFGLRNNFLASIDILLILVTLIWAMVVIIPIVPWVAYINIPYLFWVSFATGLQLSITYLNR